MYSSNNNGVYLGNKRLLTQHSSSRCPRDPAQRSLHALRTLRKHQHWSNNKTVQPKFYTPKGQTNKWLALSLALSLVLCFLMALPIVAQLGISSDALGLFKNSPTMSTMNATTWNNVYSAFGLTNTILFIIPLAAILIGVIIYCVTRTIELPSRTETQNS